MASNTILDPGAGGATLVTRQVSHDGDTAMLPGSFIFGISGTEDAYTIGAINGDATNGLDVDVTRLPALVAGTANIGDVDVLTLPALPAGTNNIGDVDVLTIAAGDNNIGNVDIVTVPAPLSTTGGGVEATALRVTLASDSTGLVSVDDNGGSLTVDGTVAVSGTVTIAGAVTNAGTFAVQVDGAALTALQLIDDGIATIAAATPAKGMVAIGHDGTNARALKTDIAGELQVDILTLPALVAGTAAIGKLAANSGVDIGDVDVTSLPAIPAGTNLIGSVAAGLSTSAIYNGTTALTPAYISIDTATSGNNTLVTPAAGKKIRVLAFNLIAVGTAVNVHILAAAVAKFGSATRPIVLDKAGTTGPAGFNSGFCPTGWFEGAADAALILNLSAAQGVVGNVVYVEV